MAISQCWSCATWGADCVRCRLYSQFTPIKSHSEERKRLNESAADKAADRVAQKTSALAAMYGSYEKPKAEEKKPVTPVDVYMAGQAYFGTHADTIIMDDPHEPSREKFKEIERLTDLYRQLMMTGTAVSKLVYTPGPEDAPLTDRIVRVNHDDFSIHVPDEQNRQRVNDFCAHVDQTGVRDTLTCGAWGEHAPVRERKHRCRRPKRPGW